MIALVDVWCSQALARLRWSDEVVSGDVDEAIRLMMMSKVMVVLLPVMVVFLPVMVVMLSVVLLSVVMSDSN